MSDTMSSVSNRIDERIAKEKEIDNEVNKEKDDSGKEERQ